MLRALICTLAAALPAFGMGCATIRPSGEPPELPQGHFSHSAFDRTLAAVVDEEGRVDYPALEQMREPLDGYFAALSQISPDNRPALFASEDDRLAYWINAYNATVLVSVLDRYPLDRVTDVRPAWGLRVPEGAGFFLQRVVLGGRSITLYGLENALIRKRFTDPRIHFALNCASASCPKLPAEAFDGSRLQSQLAREARLFLADPRNVRIDEQARSIRLSAIFDWYEEDFTRASERAGHPATLRGYLESAAPEAVRRALARCSDCRVGFFDYDWTLTDTRLEREPRTQGAARSDTSTPG